MSGLTQMVARTVRRLAGDRRGTLSVELAMAVPVLALLLLVGVEFTRYVMINQKLERTSATIADLVSQSKGMTEGEMASLFSAANFVMDPYSMANEGMLVVSSIGRPSGGVPHIHWQRTFGGGSGGSNFGSEGGAATLPTGLDVREGESIIITEAFFDYEPVIVQQVLEPDTLYKYAVFRPRFVSLTTINP